MSPDHPIMFSSKTKELLNGVRKMVPPLLEKFHKGQMGRVGVVGGSQDYTGAPYFSAMASARLGCDMSHVICEPDAAQVIKTYSPNLMIHPLLHLSHKSYPSLPKNLQTTDPKVLAGPVIELLPRLNVLVFGPGLGRDPLMLSTVKEVVQVAKEQKIPFVMDADALSLVNDDPGLVHGYNQAILTPNVVEFARLAQAVGVELGDIDMSHQTRTDDVPRAAAETATVSNKLGGVVVVRKGRVDYISNGETTLTCDLEGGLKRSGGQGDTLTGSIGTLLAWRDGYINNLWDIGEDGKMSEGETMLLAAFGGCSITRECSRLAFKDKGRALQASDVGDNVPNAFKTVIGEKQPEHDES